MTDPNDERRFGDLPYDELLDENDEPVVGPDIDDVIAELNR